MRLHTFSLIILTALAMVVMAACASPEGAATPAEEGALTEVTLMLDWVPNVNHTGIYAAQEMGYFEEAGLAVEIIQPGEVFPEQAVVAGSADYGISFQEAITVARADDVPLVSIAAIIQENTSGFAGREETGIETPADFRGLTYGAFGSQFEDPTLQSLMECAGADFSELNIENVGFADPLALLEQEQIDLAWIFFGTQGIAAEQRDVELDIVMMNDYFDCIPNYYTPVFVASEQTIAEQPETTAAFMEAISRGYAYAEENPEESARILLAVTPESGEELLIASQEWLSPRYRGDAEQWGMQELSVWQAYTTWMVENGVIAEPIDVEAAFTNEFLP